MLPRQFSSIFSSVLNVGTIEPETSFDVDGRADKDATGPGCAATCIRSLSDDALWLVEMGKTYRACLRRCGIVVEEDCGLGSSLWVVS